MFGYPGTVTPLNDVQELVSKSMDGYESVHAMDMEVWEEPSLTDADLDRAMIALMRMRGGHGRTLQNVLHVVRTVLMSDQTI